MSDFEGPDDAALYALGTEVAGLLVRRGIMLATAESCTGGWIAKTLTDIPGSSAWFDCGVAAYSYEAKQALLGVRPQNREHAGAVSEENPVEMV
jgi:nicotinamide-nucleotide amidase